MPQEQLDLGQGVVYEASDFDDHVVMVPEGITLDTDPRVDLKVMGAYLVMKSFGKRSEASLAAYAERAKCSPETFQTYQKALQQAGWATLLREGRPAPKPGEPGVPRLWWLSKVKGEAPPMSAFTQGGKKPAPGNPQGSEIPPPKQKGLEGIKGIENEAPAKAGAKHPEEKQFWAQANTEWMAYLKGKGSPESKLTWPVAMGFQKTLTNRLKQLPHEELARRWKVYLTASWPPSKSLPDFLRDVDRYTGGAQGGRYNVTRTSDFEG